MDRLLLRTGGVVLLIVIAAVAFWWFGKSSAPMVEFYPLTEASVSRDFVVEGIAAFIRGAEDTEGKFASVSRCENSSCLLVPGTEGTVFGYAVLGLLADSGGSRAESKAGADAAMTRALRLCEQDERACLWNFFAFEAYYAETGEAIYMNAMNLSGQQLLQEDTDVATVMGLAAAYAYRKMESLYELTSDRQYLTRLTTAADTILQFWPNDLDSPILYETESGYTNKYHMGLLASELFVPAYRATGDVKYLRAAADFFNQAELAEHALGMRSESGIILLLSSVEGLLTLADSDALSASERASSQTEATRIMTDLVGWQYDSPERPVGDGGHGLLTGISDANEPSGVNYKNINLNGWFGHLLSAPAFSNTPFTLYQPDAE